MSKEETCSNLMERVCSENPLYCFTTTDRVKHTVWQISKPEDIQEVESEMSRVSELYIADGHHRSASSVALKQRKSVIIGAFGLFVASGALFMTLGGEFIPELNEGDFAVETLLPTNASLSQSIKVNTAAQAMLMKKFPSEIKQVVSRIGASEIPTDPMGINSCDLIIQLKDPSEWKNAETMEELELKMDKALDVFPEVNF
jgi:cobalt-zinc-cadmium resistance protein CzcA